LSNLREKSQVFIIGLLIGLLVAGGFFVFKLDDYFKELNFYKRFAETFESEKRAAPTQEASTEKEQDSKKTVKKNKQAANSSQLNTASSSDTLGQLRADSTKVSEGSFSDEIVVKKDEMVTSKTLQVIQLSPVATKNNKDSLLQKVSGIKDDNNSKQLFNIEFWTSPLNYKGYKMGKYKLVLYGINATDDIKIYRLDDVIYLKNSAMVYQLDYVSDFKYYERITDETILSKLK
jgi:hypothetical protein